MVNLTKRARRRRASIAVGGALALALGAALVAPPAAADDIAACLGHIAGAERSHAIPEGALRAIGFAESGRTVGGRRGAWPWTVNARGQGHYFDSKDAAIEFVEGLQAQGVKVIDVGCMQVNLYYHPKAFASLDDAFDPAANVAYAAKFLVWLHDETKDWATASRYYHSRNPSVGRAYAARLTINSFGKVISSAGPIVPLTRQERETLHAEVSGALAAADALLAKSRAARQPKAAPTEAERAAASIEPAAGPAHKAASGPEFAASADAPSRQPAAPVRRKKD